MRAGYNTDSSHRFITATISFAIAIMPAYWHITRAIFNLFTLFTFNCCDTSESVVSSEWRLYLEGKPLLVTTLIE